MRESALNLIPVDIIEHENRKQRGKLWTYVAIGCLMFILSVNILVKVMNNSISKDIVAMTAATDRASREMVEIKQLDAREKELLSMRAKIQYLSRKGPMIEIFTAIDNAINDNISLTHMEAKYNFAYTSMESKEEPGRNSYFNSAIPAKTLRGQASEGNSVLLQGTALTNIDIASMLAKLSRAPLFKSVNLKYSKTGESKKGSSIMFEIESRLSERTI